MFNFAIAPKRPAALPVGPAARRTAPAHPAARLLAEPHRKGMRRPKTASRYAALIPAIGAIIGGLQLATPPPASAIPGLQRPLAVSSQYDDSPVKSATAECPDGKHVTGGGAWVNDGGHKL